MEVAEAEAAGVGVVAEGGAGAVRRWVLPLAGLQERGSPCGSSGCHRGSARRGGGRWRQAGGVELAAWVLCGCPPRG